MALTIEEWVEGYCVAWEDADAAPFTPDATYRSYLTEEPHEGASGIHEYRSLGTSDKSDVRGLRTVARVERGTVRCGSA